MILNRTLLVCCCLFLSFQSLLGSLPFRGNVGQWDPAILFGIVSGPTKVAFGSEGISWSHWTAESEVRFQMKWMGARPNVVPEGRDTTETQIHYLRTTDQAFHSHEFQTLRYPDLWPGIDLVYRAGNGSLKYDLLLAPGADPREIQFEFEGLEGIEVDPDGRLRMVHPNGQFHDAPPYSYQVRDGKKIEIPSRYQLNDCGQLGFSFPEGYDPQLPLVIDPVSIEWSTFLAGTNGSRAFLRDILLDEAGNIYGVGYAEAGFPTTPGVFNPQHNGNSAPLLDVVVFKMDPTGSSLIWATYLGGERGEQGTAIARDPAGNIYVTGSTYSTDFPASANAVQPLHGDGIFNNRDAFAAKISPNGDALLYATFFGGLGDEYGTAIDVNAAGEAFIGGYTNGGAIPTTPGVLREQFAGAPGFSDAFVFRLNPDGSQFIYSTYIGGTQSETITELIINDQNEASFTGEVNSPDFPITPDAAFRFKLGNSACAYASRLSADGSKMMASTYLCGYQGDHGEGLALNEAGDFYVTGRTYSSTFPTTPDAYDPTFGGSPDAFFARVSADGSSLQYASLYGEGGQQTGTGIRVNAAGEIFVTGITGSIDFPTTSCAMDSTHNGGNSYWGGDIFLLKFDSTGRDLLYSSLIGGSREDRLPTMELDNEGCTEGVVIAATSNSEDFPTTPGAFQEVVGGNAERSIVLRISESLDLAIRMEDSCPTPGDTFSLSADFLSCGHWTDPRQWQWDLGDGTLVGDTASLRHAYAQPGSYTVRLYRPHCPEPVAERVIDLLDLDLGPDLELCPGDEVWLDATLPRAVAYRWYDGVTEATHRVDKSGALYVDAWDAAGCQVSDTVQVTVLEGDSIEVPNAFSPNGDGINDAFFVTGLGTGRWALTVYDRWGKERYFSPAYQNDWEGDALPVGAYYYVLRNAAGCGQRMGAVNLVR